MTSHCVICSQPLSTTWAGNSRVCSSPDCERAYQDHLNRGGKLCAACGRPLHQLLRHPASSPLCSRRECQTQTLLVSRSDASCCQICGIYLSPLSGMKGHCNDRYCRNRMSTVLAARDTQRRQAKRRKSEELALALWQTEQTPATSDRLPLPIVLPANRHSLQDETQRKQIFRERLLSIAATALEVELPPATEAEPSSPETAAALPTDSQGDTAPQGETEPQSEELSDEHTLPALDAIAAQRFSELAAQGCATCRGHCCYCGGDHAFLTAEVLRRIAKEEQIHQPSELAKRFLDFMPQQTFVDSCLFHGELGCGLPRHMRANICNDYLCPGLQQLQQHCEAQTSPTVYILAATNVEEELDSPPQVYSQTALER
ncbi:MAG: hypothetical protein KDA45_12660 [Planctomycetales bacterium]|nr:hypothetical protein [Planctomycetales bacterium]